MNKLFSNSEIKLLTYIASLVALTGIHHIYGAIIYKTPWRLHTLFINIPFFLLVYFSFFIRKKTKSRLLVKLLKHSTAMTVIILWVFWVGLFEGVYNHILKNIVFFSGLSRSILLTLYPSEIYEMPNDFFFEFTGIIQVVPLPYIISATRSFYKADEKAIQ